MTDTSFVRESVDSPDAAVAFRLRAGSLLLLPDRAASPGLEYVGGNAGLVGAARAEGIAVDVLAPEDRRPAIEESGAGQLAVDIAIGIVGNLSTDLLKNCYTLAKLKLAGCLGIPFSKVSDPDERVHMQLTRYRSGSVKLDRFEFEGSLSGLKLALESLALQADEGDHEG